MEKLNRTTVIIASIIFAVGLWLTVNLGIDHTTVKNVPFVVQHLDRDIALRLQPPGYLRVRMRGEGWKLLGMQLGGDLRYVVDASGERSTVVIHTPTELQDRMRLPGGIEVIEISPERITLQFEEKDRKRIPLVPEMDVTFRNGFNRVGPVSIVPDSLTIEGAASVLDRINRWRTDPLVLHDVRDPVRQTVQLSDTLGGLVSLDIGQAEVHFDVQPIAEKTISGLRILVEGTPANREVLIIPPRVDIVIRGGINQLAAVEDNDFSIRIHYREILADTSGTLPVNVEGPREVRIVQQNPDRIQYVIRRSQ
jgi:YbbR domain-containing protein